MAKLLKDEYDKEYITQLSSLIKNEYSLFDENKFHSLVFDSNWKHEELKQRSKHIAQAMNISIPLTYKETIDILKPVSTYFCRMQAMCFSDYVEEYGLQNWNISIKAMEHFTQYGTSEFAIRQFILIDEQKAMKQMLLWAQSENVHIRRLACEGCRPRLPWAISLPIYKNNPKQIIEILEILKDDKEKYVQKSVANNLNDISKDNPTIVINLLKQWYGKSTITNWILKHGCRTLLKVANKEVLEVFGYNISPAIKVNNLNSLQTVSIGQELEFSFDLHSNTIINKLRLEFKILFAKANNKISSKIFKISEITNFKGAKHISKKFSFKKISTRKYYKGEHKLYIIINGKSYLETKFNLV